jgi:PAS domain S-box
MPPAPLQLLLVEDDETDAFLETRELQRAGFVLAPTRVATEADLRAALVRQPWDLVLCDYTLPGFSGSEALRISKELAPETPFIFVSGTIGEAAIVEAMRSGAQDYVMKDRLNRLAPAVSRELREAATRREARLNERWMRETEHKYRQLFDALTEAVFVIDQASGRILDTNRQAEHLLGRERHAIVGQNHNTLFASPRGALVLAELREAAASPDRGGLVLHLLKPGGRRLPVHASASPIELYGRSLLLVLMHTRLERPDPSAPGLTADQILAEVSTWPHEAVEDLLGRLARLHHEESPAVGRR